MDVLNGIGSIASIIGLAVTFYVLHKVNNLPSALKQLSRDKQLSALIDKINRVPPSKPTMPDSTAREVEALIRTIRLYYVSRIPFRNRQLKSMLAALEEEIRSQKQLHEIASFRQSLSSSGLGAYSKIHLGLEVRG